MTVFEFIAAEKADFPIKFMCERFCVNRPGFPGGLVYCSSTFTTLLRTVYGLQQPGHHVLQILRAPDIATNRHAGSPR